MILGVSWLGVMIMGVLLLGVDCKIVVEYSFFFVILVMVVVSVKELWEVCKSVEVIDWSLIGVGFVVLFVVVLVVIKVFIGIVSKYGFVLFVWYWIVVGIVVLVWLINR